MTQMGVGDVLVVQKLLHHGAASYRWTGQVLEWQADHVVFGAEFQLDARDLGYVTFERGDVFYEYYYFNRWYNVFQVYSASGVLKGWYCNVGAPARVGDGQLTFVDFALDVFAYPDRSFVVLDEDEFEELSRSTYRPSEVEAARRALAELTELAGSGRLPGRPFGGLPTPTAGL